MIDNFASMPTTAPQVVTFKVGRQTYALPLEVVLQVVRLPALTLMPEAPPELCGMLNLRGTFIPVLDVHMLVGQTSAVNLSSQVLIISDGAGRPPMLGLLVDTVETVRRFPIGSFSALNGVDMLVMGMLRDHEDVVIVLDPEALLVIPGGVRGAMPH